MIRILYVNGGLMNRGGIESFMMNYYRHFDRNEIQIDFLVHNAGGFGYYDEEIKQMGGRVMMLPRKSTHPFSYIKALRKVFSEGNYKIVHTHMDAMGAVVLKVAKDYGVPVRIAHSHNTRHLTSNVFKLWMLEKARKKINLYSTHRMACGEEAGKWLFGDADFQVVRNAIEVERFRFNETSRREVRREYHVADDEFLIGHVGRFDVQKNHKFLLDVFAEVSKRVPQAKLMLVGGGGNNTLAECEKRVAELHLQDRVIFCGVQSDVPKFYSAFDVFALPSLFEGLVIVAVEAQVNGCPCVLSSSIPQEVNISGDVCFLPLQQSYWVDKLVELTNGKATRSGADFDVNNTGYNIETEAQLLQKKYIELWNEN